MRLGSTAFEGGRRAEGVTTWTRCILMECACKALTLSRRECLSCRVGSDELCPGDSDHRYQVCARLLTLKLHFTAQPGLVA